MKFYRQILETVSHTGSRTDLGLQGPINKKRILEPSQVIFWNKTTGLQGDETES